MPVRVVLHRGPKAKRAVAFALDWPGWCRGARTADEALELLASYRARYRPVTEASGLAEELDGGGRLKVVADEIASGSTDFWGISFVPSALETEPMTPAELERKLSLLQASWGFFDTTAASVSAQMRKGPRGGGRDRDIIIRHTVRTESEDFAKKVGLRIPEEAALSPKGLRAHRASYLEAMRAYNAGEGKRMRTWNLPFLIRHSAFHTMDHAWEMQDKDLSSEQA